MKLLLISILLFFVTLVHGQDNEDVNANMNCDINPPDGYMFVGYKTNTLADPPEVTCWGCRDNASQQFEILGSSCNCKGNTALERCLEWEPCEERVPVPTSNLPPPPTNLNPTATTTAPPAATPTNVPLSSSMRHFVHAVIAVVTVASIILV